MELPDHRIFRTPAPTPPHRTVRHGPWPTAAYDLRLPPTGGERGTTVVLIHGGYWREEIDRAHLAPLAQALADDGYHVAALEYSRTGMDARGWRGTIEDVCRGLSSVTAQRDLPRRTVVVGHSVGGLLALWAGSEDRYAGLAAVVALGPVADVVQCHALGLADGAATRWMGCTPEAEPSSWAVVDVLEQRLTTPATLLCGGADDRVPLSLTESYLATRGAADAPSVVEVIDGADHFDLIDPGHEGCYSALVRAINAAAAPA